MNITTVQATARGPAYTIQSNVNNATKKSKELRWEFIKERFKGEKERKHAFDQEEK